MVGGRTVYLCRESYHFFSYLGNFKYISFNIFVSANSLLPPLVIIVLFEICAVLKKILEYLFY